MSDSTKSSPTTSLTHTLHIETLTTGDELLSGEWADQHGRTIAQATQEYGVLVRRFNSVGDQLNELISVISEISDRADLCVITGGLGPTEDDLTLDALAVVARSPRHISDDLWSDLVSRFPKLKRAAESNRKQARVMMGGEVLPNEQGTAPGVRVHIGRCTFMAFPGVPQETRWFISRYLSPWLQARFGGTQQYNKVVRVALIGESVIAERIKKLALPKHVQIGYQALGSEHRIKISAPHLDALSSAVTSIKRVAGDHYLNDRDLSLAEQLLELARKREVTFGFAESCTGGQLSAAITQIPGSSSSFWGGVISYSNEVKQALLGVTDDTLIMSGAISEACAAEMAQGTRDALGVDWAVSVTGVAGPGGGSTDMPVGTVCFGWANAEDVTVERKHFLGDRHRIQRTAVAYALLTLLRRLSKFSSKDAEHIPYA